ncbi:hypothetical protein AMTR_s00062p00133130 [Amborella trichopoda]|uniref:Uncharacterized protein n=1 Tax=Amborella trichopoda TaxID=13333 RepID=U5DGR3_AMBTC|nr:hypothetical protein AMTR_s00062p00133130 [Amborella trichopoda]
MTLTTLKGFLVRESREPLILRGRKSGYFSEQEGSARKSESEESFAEANAKERYDERQADRSSLAFPDDEAKAISNTEEV